MTTPAITSPVYDGIPMVQMWELSDYEAGGFDMPGVFFSERKFGPEVLDFVPLTKVDLPLLEGTLLQLSTGELWFRRDTGFEYPRWWGFITRMEHIDTNGIPTSWYARKPEAVTSTLVSQVAALR
jgi:hypothetical protein